MNHDPPKPQTETRPPDAAVEDNLKRPVQSGNAGAPDFIQHLLSIPRGGPNDLFNGRSQPFATWRGDVSAEYQRGPATARRLLGVPLVDTQSLPSAPCHTAPFAIPLPGAPNQHLVKVTSGEFP